MFYAWYWRRLLTLEVLLRCIADVLIVNTCYLFALMLRAVLAVDLSKPIQMNHPLETIYYLYLSHAGLLTLLSLVVFIGSGFYTQGRFYRSRFKLLVIIQGVSITYVLFGFLQYLGSARDWLLTTPRIALFLGWGFTILGAALARLWATIWSVVVKRERRAHPESNSKGPIRRVLVIGGAGYIGSVLVRELLHRGYEVRVLDKLLYGKQSLLELEKNNRFELIHGDSRDITSVITAMLDTDAVVHLGELVGDPACDVNENLTLEINFAATQILGEVAKGYGVKRFVYASSCSVYGVSDELLDEQSVCSPLSIYARAKLAAERALLGLDGATFHPVVLRLATVYGFSFRPRFDLVVNLLTAKAYCEQKLPILGGTQWRPFIHVRDVCHAITLEAPLVNVKGQIFNVGHEAQNKTILEVADMIKVVLPSAKIEQQNNPNDLRNYRIDFKKIQRELNFLPVFSLEEGILEIKNALLTKQIADYLDPRFNNKRTVDSIDTQQELKNVEVSKFFTLEVTNPSLPLPPPVT